VAEKNEWRLELMLGCRVRSQDGRVIGRLEEFRAERENDYYVVTEFHVGPAAMIERLAVRHLGLTLPGRAYGYRVRWDQLDLEDPARPRLTCPVEELERLGAPRRIHRPTRAA
jgi:hypothetical protein